MLTIFMFSSRSISHKRSYEGWPKLGPGPNYDPNQYIEIKAVVLHILMRVYFPLFARFSFIRSTQPNMKIESDDTTLTLSC